MTILDSSVWIAFLLTDDSQHQKATRVIRATRGDVVVPESVIGEICTVLSVRFKRKDIADQFIGMLVGGNMEILYSDSSFFDAVLALYQRTTGHALSFTDVTLLHLAEEHDVVTFDASLRAAIARAEEE